MMITEWVKRRSFKQTVIRRGRGTMHNYFAGLPPTVNHNVESREEMIKVKDSRNAAWRILSIFISAGSEKFDQTLTTWSCTEWAIECKELSIYVQDLEEPNVEQNKLETRNQWYSSIFCKLLPLHFEVTASIVSTELKCFPQLALAVTVTDWPGIR